MEKVTIGVLSEGFIDPSYYRLTPYIWNDFDKFRTGPRTTPTVSATGPWFWFGTIGLGTGRRCESSVGYSVADPRLPAENPPPPQEFLDLPLLLDIDFEVTSHSWAVYNLEGQRS